MGKTLHEGSILLEDINETNRSSGRTGKGNIDQARNSGRYCAEIKRDLVAARVRRNDFNLKINPSTLDLKLLFSRRVTCETHWPALSLGFFCSQLRDTWHSARTRSKSGRQSQRGWHWRRPFSTGCRLCNGKPCRQALRTLEIWLKTGRK